MNRILTTLFLILFLTPLVSALSVERTLENNTAVILYDLNTSTPLNTIIVELKPNETAPSILISNYKETIPTIFTVTNLLPDNSELTPLADDIYNFDVFGSTARYRLSLPTLTPERLNCISTYYLSGSYNILDISNDIIYTDQIIPDTRINIYPINEDIKLYSAWDLNINKKIDRNEIIIAVVSYFEGTIPITKESIMKLIKLFFSGKEFETPPLCQ